MHLPAFENCGNMGGAEAAYRDALKYCPENEIYLLAFGFFGGHATKSRGVEAVRLQGLSSTAPGGARSESDCVRVVRGTGAQASSPVL